MRTVLIVICVFAVLGCLGGGLYLWLQHREDVAQEERDRSPPAQCAKQPFMGVADVCWTDVQECWSRKIDCEPVDAYACFRGVAITSKKRTKWCARTFGDCVTYRRDVARDPEYADLSECLIYRSAAK
jgi:hypothetical protein